MADLQTAIIVILYHNRCWIIANVSAVSAFLWPCASWGLNLNFSVWLRIGDLGWGSGDLGQWVLVLHQLVGDLQPQVSDTVSDAALVSWMTLRRAPHILSGVLVQTWSAQD